MDKEKSRKLSKYEMGVNTKATKSHGRRAEEEDKVIYHRNHRMRISKEREWSDLYVESNSRLLPCRVEKY